MHQSALQYHFGGRDGLIAAILAKRGEEMEARRRTHLQAAIISIGGGSDKTAQVANFTAANFKRDENNALVYETINGSSMVYIEFNHNLGKKPAISVEQEGSPGQVAMMPVKYIDDNTVNVYFTGTTSGSIYAN